MVRRGARSQSGCTKASAHVSVVNRSQLALALAHKISPCNGLAREYNVPMPVATG